MMMINSIAPIRICDNGGWTDTWFAEYGSIFNMAVTPYAEVQIALVPFVGQADRVWLSAENYGDAYPIDPTSTAWKKHPLLEAAVHLMGVPDDVACRITVYSDAPGGASTGTSAAVTVALIAALDRLTPGQLTAHQIAHLAHRVESDLLGLQSGIQDQLCSAYGGINYIDMQAYPYGSVSPIHLDNAVWRELEQRLVLVYLGNSHQSSQVHEMVIRELEAAGAHDGRIEALRQTAGQARDALLAADFPAFGATMIANTAAQAALHPDLVSPAAHRIIDIARQHAAVGWKVNGAGGNGGSLTLLCGTNRQQKRAMIAAIKAADPLFQILPITLSERGVQTWITP